MKENRPEQGTGNSDRETGASQYHETAAQQNHEVGAQLNLETAAPKNHETGVPHPSSAWVGTGSTKYLGPLIILLAALLAITPQLIRGNSCGHDFNVHLVSWLDCVNSWKHGILYPHWTPSPNYGAGEPRFVFYPPLTWMLGALLGLIFPWTFAPIAMTFLTLAGTGLASRALALEALDDLPATLAGCIAMFSGFTLFTGYERSAFPEFAGGVWLPLLLLFALRHRRTVQKSGVPPISILRPGSGEGTTTNRVPPVPRTWEPGRDSESPSEPSLTRRASLACRIFDGSAAPLALMLAATWLSNLPLAVIAMYLLAGVALLASAVRRTWAPVLRVAVATPLGLGLSALYWFPAAMERNWVDIRQATQDPGYNFENNWLFVHNSNPTLAPHDAINHQASWIAISMIAVSMIALAICWRRGTLPAPDDSPRWWFPLATIPVIVLFFSFPVSRPLWYLLPEMRFLQYPWRLLEAVEAPMAIFVVAAIWPVARRAGIAVLSACAVWFVASTVFAGSYFFQVCYPEDTVASTLVDYRDGAGFEGMYEYEPPDADISQIATGLPDACLVSDPSVVLGKPNPDDPDANPAWSPPTCDATYTFLGDGATNPEHRQIRAFVAHPGYLVLRLLSYPDWQVRLNGQLFHTDRTIELPLPKRDDGLIAVPVPQGQVALAVDWTTTSDVVFARCISALSILLLAALWFFEPRRKRVRLT
jgi:hypothetical protein